MDTRELAKDIINDVGGKENIVNLEHCVTRLRFTLKDNAAAKTDSIKQMDGVMTVVISGGQYQVVIGNKVKDVFEEVTAQLGNSVNKSESVSENGGKQKNWFNRFVGVIIGVVTPFLGLMAATGLIKGLLGLATALNWLDATDGTYILLNALGDSLFYFLPIFVGFSAGKKFNANPFVTAVIGGALVYPTIITANSAGDPLSFAGIPVVLANYTSSLFPIIMGAWLASVVQRWFEKRLPSALKLIFVPFFTLIITGIITFLVVGPVLSEFSQLLADVTMGIYNFSPVAAGIILGALWQGIVIFGMHYAFIPVLINNITTLHYDPVNAILTVTVFAQVGAALGVFLKAKNQKIRGIAGSATVSALMGVTEPAIYGVSLPYKKPFIMAGIGGGIAGAIITGMGARMYGFGGTGIFAAPLYINPDGIDISFYAFLIASAVALIVTAVLTYFFGFNKTMEQNGNDAPVDASAADSKPAAAPRAAAAEMSVYNVLQGTIVPLAEVKDEAFASGAMGSGYAVIPEDSKVYAPFDGTVVTVANSKHAVAFVSDEGVELLVHMGINTVKLKGAPFEIKVQENERVQKGQLVAIVDWELIRSSSYDVTTPIIVTNSAEHRSVEVKLGKAQQAQPGELALSIT